MKDKILIALKTRYKHLGFSEKALDGVAGLLATMCTEEEKIEEFVSGAEAMLKSFQAEIDTRVTSAVSKKDANKDKTEPTKSEPQPPAGGSSEPGKNDQPDEEVKKMLKTLLASNEALTKEIQAIKATETSKSRKQKLETAMEGMPEAFKNSILKGFTRLTFESDEDFNTYLTEIGEAGKAFEKEMAEKGLVHKPLLGGDTDEQSIKQSIEDWAKRNTPAEAAK